MGRLLLTIVLVLLAGMASAKTAWYYDTDRSGEGIILTELPNDDVVFAFYSHTARKLDPPIVSPAPPDPLYCDEYTVWFTGITDYRDGDIAEGKVYYDVAVPTFPIAEDKMVSRSVEVGRFWAWREAEGFVLLMENNYTMCNLTVFGTEHHFVTKLVE